MTSPQAIARMVERATRKAAVGRARSAMVRFDAFGLPDLITFPGGATAAPAFATYTSTLLPAGMTTPGATLPMLVVPLDGGGWVPVSYMPEVGQGLVEVTLELPMQRMWTKNAEWSGTQIINWVGQSEHTAAAPGVALQGLLFNGWDWYTQCAVFYFGDIPALIPSGATIHGVKLVLARTTTISGGWLPLPEREAETATPIIRAHTHTPASPPVHDAPPAFVADSTLAAAPMTMGAVQQLDAWATGLLSGAITGAAIGTGRGDDDPGAFHGVRLLITYTGGAPSE